MRKEKSKKRLPEMCAQGRREGLETDAEENRGRVVAMRGRRDEKDKVVKKDREKADE